VVAWVIFLFTTKVEKAKERIRWTINKLNSRKYANMEVLAKFGVLCG